MRDDKAEEFFQQLVDEYEREDRDVLSRLQRTDGVLQTARDALAQVASPGLLIKAVSAQEFMQQVRETQKLPPEMSEFISRVVSAIRIATVFGVAATQALQSIRNQADGFDDWWEPHSKRLQEDPLARTFWLLRNVLLHQGHAGLTFAKLDAYNQADGTAVFIAPRFSGVTVKLLTQQQAEEPALILTQRYIETVDAILAEAWSIWVPTAVRGKRGVGRIHFLER